MTFPTPGPTPGGFRPGPSPGGFRPGPTPGGFRPGPPPVPRPPTHEPAAVSVPAAVDQQTGEIVRETGHPAVDAVLSALENASRLAPSEQIAEYEAAHQVLQETLASIDR